MTTQLLKRESLPNLLTGARLALIPVLWALALAGEVRWVGIGVGVAGATDGLDGFLARRFDATSAFGSRFDSIADHLLFASTIAWLAMFRSEFIREQLPVLLVWLGIGALSFAVGWVRFRRFADLHLYSAKLAVVLGLIFAVYLLVLDDYSVWIFRVVATVAIVAAIETLLVQLTRDEVDEHIGSILKRT